MLLLRQQRRSRSTIGGLVVLSQLSQTVSLDYNNFIILRNWSRWSYWTVSRNLASTLVHRQTIKRDIPTEVDVAQPILVTDCTAVPQLYICPCNCLNYTTAHHLQGHEQWDIHKLHSTFRPIFIQSGDIMLASIMSLDDETQLAYTTWKCC